MLRKYRDLTADESECFPMSLLTKLRHSTACQLGRPYHHRDQSTSLRCGIPGVLSGLRVTEPGPAARRKALASCRAPSAGWGGRANGAADEPVPPRGPAGLPGAMSTHRSGCAPAGRRSAPCMLLHPRRPLPPPLPPPPQHGGGGGAGPARGEVGRSTARPSTRAPQGTAPGGKKAPPRGTQRGSGSCGSCGGCGGAHHPLCPPSCLGRMVRAAAGGADGGREAQCRATVRLSVLGRDRSW